MVPQPNATIQPAQCLVLGLTRAEPASAAVSWGWRYQVNRGIMDDQFRRLPLCDCQLNAGVVVIFPKDV